MRKKKIILFSILSTLIFVIALAGFVTYAFFSTRVKVYTADGKELYAQAGMKLDLLFDRISGVDPGTCLYIKNRSAENNQIDAAWRIKNPNASPADYDGYCYYDPTAKWGSKNNPYIISNIKHLQNLSALQEVGYFTSYTEQFKATENGGAGNGAEAMPYFLVCSPNGKPIGIDGTGKTIKPIGDDNNPFIGYVGGAFNKNTTDVAFISNLVEADESIIFNLNVQTTEDVPDVGLFGTIGFLGTELSFENIDINDFSSLEDFSHEVTDYLSANHDKTNIVGFTGGISTIENLVLSDIKVVVDKPRVVDKIGDLIDKHYYSYTTSTVEVPHETHHAGILAGHISYCDIEYVSVYYTNQSVKAFDISHKSKTFNNLDANYYSQSGIIGMIYNLNPVALGGYVGPNEKTNAIIEGATGSGGGSLSGEGTGYVTAYEIYNSYNNSGNVVSYEIDEYTYYSLLVIEVIESNDNKYYLMNHEGDTPYEVTLSNNNISASIIEHYSNFWGQTQDRTTTWNDFVVKRSDGKYYHKNMDEFEVAEEDLVNTGIYIRYGYKVPNEELCKEWVRPRIIFGTQNSGEYYFTDGVFTFALSDNKDTIENTWPYVYDEIQHQYVMRPDKFYIGDDNKQHWLKDTSNGLTGVLAYVSEIKSNEDFLLATKQGKTIYIGVQTTNQDPTTGQSNLFLMDLYSVTEGVPTTSGETYSTISNDRLTKLLNAYDTHLYDNPDYEKSAPQLESYSSFNTFSDIRTKIARDGRGISEWIVIDMGHDDKTNELKTKNKILSHYSDDENYATKYVYSLIPGDEENDGDENNYEGLLVNFEDKNYNIYEAEPNAYWNGYFLIDTVVSGSDSGYFVRYNSISTSTNTGTYINKNTDSTDKSIKYVKETYTTTTPPDNVETYGQIIYTGTVTENDESVTRSGIIVQRINNSYVLLDGTEVVINGNRVTPKNPDSYSYVSATYGFGENYFYREFNYDEANPENSSYKYYYVSSVGTPVEIKSESIEFKEFIIDKTNGLRYAKFIGNDINDNSYNGVLLEKSNYFYFTDGESKNNQYLLHTNTRYDSSSSCGGSTTTVNVSDLSFSFGPIDKDNNGNDIVSTSDSSSRTEGRFVTATIETTNTYTKVKNCSVLRSGDGWYIQYTYADSNGNVIGTRYIYYEDGLFKGSTSVPSTLTPIRLFVLEATQLTDGYATIIPTAENTSAKNLSADQYVLWPDTSLHPSTSGERVTKSDNPTYYVVPVSQLGDFENYIYENGKSGGWPNGSGTTSLSALDLSKKFKLLKGIDTGTSISLFNGVLNANGYITAPVGSMGIEANIPLGTVAFRVNKSNPDGLYVRVIVSVAATTRYNNTVVANSENNYPYSFTNDYYLALWHSEASGDSLVTTFDNQSSMEKVEIPRSNRYSPEDNIGIEDGQDNPTSNYIKVKYGTGSFDSYTEYRSYLNGSTVLMAYTFKLTEEGVYVLGVEGDLKDGSTMPMQIVYFSVDATASAGRDGATGSMLGTVDFVYDNGIVNADGRKTILTVKASSDDGGEMNFANYYYASLCRLYTKNNLKIEDNYVNINDFGCSLIRTQNTTNAKITISRSRNDKDYIDVERLNEINSDAVEANDSD